MVGVNTSSLAVEVNDHVPDKSFVPSNEVLKHLEIGMTESPKDKQDEGGVTNKGNKSPTVLEDEN